MRYSLFPALLGLAITSVQAAPAVILEQTKGIPPGWSFQANASASDKITLFVALKEPGIEELKAKLNQRQNPAHPSFGRHLSRNEVRQHRKPADATAVTSWLKGNGIRAVHDQGSLISFEASAEMVKSLFQADLAYYGYQDSDADPVLRALSYKIPAWLRDHIDFVHPITNFMPPRPHLGHRRRPKPRPHHPKPHWPHPKPTKKPPAEATSTTTTTTKSSTTTSSASSSNPTLIHNPSHEEIFPNLPCLAATVPSCIKKLYNITYAPDSNTPSPVRFGVAGFLEQYILHSDVDHFLDTFTPTLPPTYNFTVELLHNATNPQDSPSNAGMEASLDVQYAMSLGHPTNIIYYLTAGRGVKLDATTGIALPVRHSDNEPFLEFLTSLLAKPDAEIPHVLSISYADDEVGVPRAYALRVCDLFAALAARGTTVLVATGDGGAAGTGQTDCVDRDTGMKRFVPTFPASCPYVTAVGATGNVAPPVAGAGFSSGGFSDFFGRPAWQDEVVKPYVKGLVKANDTRAALINHDGRAVPDISAIGSAFQIVMGGSMSQVLGTSASTPVVAAMVALVNDARMRAGKPSLGWLNPLLYSAKVKSVLRDVTVGDSAGCWFPDNSRSPGWSAGEGYDLVTGLGVVDDFNDFLEALM
ncbi:tripeptidyl-peptidase-like protein [Chaetomium fimeti]|uniref:tripeptidyl-peptidase II n=1 Tax=Chaetomium fimeti TaxID=1854472 RepID=A0AAE0H5U9_9PEZI|nr:tripeptidyl-peptidase-like protein [Chaetomium fimeti]